MYRTFICVALLLPQICFAEGFAVLFNGKSFHASSADGRNLNENNYGLGIQYDFEKSPSGFMPFLAASYLEDSDRDTTIYAGIGALQTIATLGTFRADVGAIGFVMSRPSYHDGDPFLGILPAITIGNDSAALQISYAPSVEPKMVSFWFVQLKVTFY